MRRLFPVVVLIHVAALVALSVSPAQADIGGSCTTVADCGTGWAECVAGRCYNSGNCRSDADCLAPQTCGAIQPDSGNGQCAGVTLDISPTPEISGYLVPALMVSAGAVLLVVRRRRNPRSM